MTISDAALAKSADEVAESLGSLYLNAEVPEHIFSEAFQVKMDAVISKRHKKTKVISVIRYIAASLILAMLLGGAYIAASPDACADFINWIRSEWENSIIYHFFTGDRIALPVLRPTWLPDGFELVEETEHENFYNSYYENGRKEQFFDFTYHLYTDEILEIYGYSEDQYDIEKVEFNGYYGEFYRSLTGEENNLIVFDDNNSIAISITGTIEKEDMIKIIESIR